MSSRLYLIKGRLDECKRDARTYRDPWQAVYDLEWLNDELARQKREYDELSALHDAVMLANKMLCERDLALCTALNNALAELHHHFGCDPACKKRHVAGAEGNE